MASPNRPADLPKSTYDTTYFFFWLQNLINDISVITNLGCLIFICRYNS